MAGSKKLSGYTLQVQHCIDSSVPHGSVLGRCLVGDLWSFLWV